MTLVIAPAQIEFDLNSDEYPDHWLRTLDELAELKSRCDHDIELIEIQIESQSKTSKKLKMIKAKRCQKCRYFIED